jgi:cysteine-rich repeat protein
MDSDTGTDSDMDSDTGSDTQIISEAVCNPCSSIGHPDKCVDSDTTPPPSQPYNCGDGILNIGEICDDGNTASGDGCSPDCRTMEAEFYCPYPGKPCVHAIPHCGNGLIDHPDEMCDDANNINDDDCDNNCLCRMPE